jgi:ketosteroid isomerase-like protein
MKNPNKESLRILEHFYSAASRGDFSPVRDALDPSVEWIEPVVPGLWSSGIHRGADAVWREVIEPTLQKFDGFRVSIKKIYAVGDQLIAIGSFHGRAKGTGKSLNAATAHVCTLHNGKIVRFEAFHDSASWMEALNLAQSGVDRLAA